MLPQSDPTSTGSLREFYHLLQHCLRSIPRYGELEHLEEMDNPRYASMCFQQIYHIGDTKSGQELEVFLTMPLERLRPGSGMNVQRPCSAWPQSTATPLCSGTQTPPVWTETHVRYCSEAEEALGNAMRPLLQLQDEHVLATLSACSQGRENWSAC